MKSIKEKAIEVFPEHCNFYTNSCNERKRIGFVAGANYVLDEIEKLVIFKRWAAQDLYNLIKQLKK